MEFNPEYAISHNPDRTKLTIPYTIAALQKAGAKLAAQATNGVQVTNSDTSNTNSDTKNKNSDTDIIATLTPNQKKVLEFCTEPRSSREILEHVGVSFHSKNIKKYITDLVKLRVLQMTNPESPNDPNQRYYSRYQR